MSEVAKLSTHLHRLEAQAIIEQEYDEQEAEDVLDIYDNVVKHIGFEDKRRDKRFIVKFHDIIYYTPEDVVDAVFAVFCDQVYDDYMEEMAALNINVNRLLDARPVGSYRPFHLLIPHINEHNAVDVAREIYDAMLPIYYVDDYVAMVDAMQHIEDTYMEQWIEFLKELEFPDKTIKTIEEAYNKSKRKEK